MNVIYNHLSTFCTHGYMHALQLCPGCLPAIPAPRPAAAPTMEELVEIRARTRAAKKHKSAHGTDQAGQTGQANQDDQAEHKEV